MWRDTMRDVTFLGLNAWALAPLGLVPFLGWSWWTFGVAAVVAVIFGIMRAMGLTIEGAARRLRSWLAGKERPATPVYKQRYFA